MTGRWIWIGALALTLSVLGVDAARRMRDIEAITDARVGARLQPEVDPASPSGYRWGQHRLILPETDGYPWLLQTEQSLERGALRVRSVEYDNAPAGREVHWAAFERGWALGLTGLYRLAHPELSAPQALERVAPWANTALLVVFLLVLTPLVAARFGPLPASLLAVGCVAVFPFYDQLRLGNFDHHGPAILACLVAVLLLVAGGAGWVRSADVEPPRPGAEHRALWDWLPPQDTAPRWFVAAGVAGGIGLWISAATMTPVLIGTGLAALVGVGVVPRARMEHAAARLDPTLFRAWGAAGAATSFCLYLAEYFPGYMGMRLEVNHPLYAVAFLGGGDLIARVAAHDSRSSSKVRWLVIDLAMILLLPAVILTTGESTFRLSDPFLWTLHNRYIVEFLDLAARSLLLTPAQVVGQLSLVALAALPIAALLWPTALASGWRTAWRALLLASVGASGAYAYVFFLRLTGGSAVAAAMGATGAVALWFLLPVSRRPAALAPPWQAALLLASLPALVALLLSLTQARWLGLASALWLGALVVTAAVVVKADHPFARTAAGRASGGALALIVLVVAPAFFLRQPFSPPNVGLITRDASLWLRRRIGADPAVILAGPTATTYMTWFGGFRGLGTLYWENLEGLRASAQICSAPDPDSARALLARHGVTHVAVFGWDQGLEQLELAAHAVRNSTKRNGARGSGPLQEMCTHQPRELPPWLVPLPYVPPRVAGFSHPVVQIYEVVDDLPPQILLLRQARYHQAVEDDRMQEALDRSLELGPSVPGLAMMAQLQHARGDRSSFQATIAQLRAELTGAESIELGDRIEAAIALVLAGDGQEASSQLAVVLDQADERQLRRVSPERISLLVDLSRQVGLDRGRPEAIALALRLLRGT